RAPRGRLILMFCRSGRRTTRRTRIAPPKTPFRGGRALKIAQVAPLYESVPPKLYGGTERIVSYLTEDLVRRGHDVTLFASGDSETHARLRSPVAHALRLDPTIKDQLSHHIMMVEQVAQEASGFDIVHYHIDYLHYPTTRRT